MARRLSSIDSDARLQASSLWPGPRGMIDWLRIHEQWNPTFAPCTSLAWHKPSCPRVRFVLLDRRS